MGKHVPEIYIGVVNFVEKSHRGTLVGVLIGQIQVDHPVPLLVWSIRGS
jgi:hypothetical protein